MPVDVHESDGPMESSRIYVPSSGPESWKLFLADPVKHWRKGFSACTLAHSWEHAEGKLPVEIEKLFVGIDSNPTLLLAIPEHKVPLPGSKRGASQSDLFALVRTERSTYAVTVEGKVDEPFDRTLGDWLTNASPGKHERLAYICDLLGLKQPLPNDVHYQLLHRTAAAIIEADRFKTDAACMVVHSFSPSKRWFEAFANFAQLFDVDPKPDQLYRIRCGSARPTYIGWACGDERYLSRYC